MKRLTMKDVHAMNMTELALNQVFVQNGWAWYIKAPEDECGVCGLIRDAAMAEVRERLKLYEDICFAEDGTELLTPWVLRIFREARLNTGPLTEEQLREMDGEPVYLDLGDGGEWVLVRLMENEVYFSHKNTICAPGKIAFECGGKVYLFKPKSFSNAE